MNEKDKAEAIARSRSVQPSQSSEVTELQQVIEENIAIEATLYAQRGYGGYIDTEQIKAIRATRDEAVERIEELRGQKRVQRERMPS